MTQRDAMRVILEMTQEQREAVAVWIETQDDNCVEGYAEQRRLASEMRRDRALMDCDTGRIVKGPLESGTPVYMTDGRELGTIIPGRE